MHAGERVHTGHILYDPSESFSNIAITYLTELSERKSSSSPSFLLSEEISILSDSSRKRESFQTTMNRYLPSDQPNKGTEQINHSVPPLLHRV